MATTEDSPSNDETTVKKEFASFVAVGDGNETKFDIFKAGFISGRNASTMEQSKDAASSREEETMEVTFTNDELSAVREALAVSAGVPAKLGNAYESALRKLNVDA